MSQREYWTMLRRCYSRMICLTVLALFLVSTNGYGQEFNAQVSVIAPQNQSFPIRIIESLENNIIEFLNNRRFTNFNYSVEERIEMNLLFTVQEQPAIDQFKGKFQITYSRPIYGSDYNSAVVTLVDNDIEFRYLENTQIEFSPERYQNNLSSILGFYAYFILGLDGDTFSELGGTDFYNVAQQVVGAAQNSGRPGWNAFEGTSNRYWLVDNQLQAVFRPFRKCLYEYHRLGFDTMQEDVVTARSTIMTSIEGLKPVHQTKPASYNLQIFFTAKADELVNLFKPADAREKAKLFNTLQIIDPANLTKYQNMMRGS